MTENWTREKQSVTAIQAGRVRQFKQRTSSLGVEFQKFELGQTLPGFWWVFVEDSGAEVL